MAAGDTDSDKGSNSMDDRRVFLPKPKIVQPYTRMKMFKPD